MLFSVTCPVCTELSRSAQVETLGAWIIPNAPLSQQIINENIASLKCPNGHDYSLYFQNEKYEISFDYALCFIDEGHYATAISEFVTSVECFYEYWLRCKWLYIGLNLRQQNEIIQDKSLNDSKKRYKEFLRIYKCESNESPAIISFETRNIRNLKAHNFYVADRNQAIKAGSEALNFFATSIPELDKFFPGIHLKMLMFSAQNSQAEERISLPTVTVAGGVTLDRGNLESARTKDFEEIISQAVLMWKILPQYSAKLGLLGADPS